MYFMNYGGSTHNGNQCAYTSVNDQLVSPKVLKSIDTKLDDGNAILGVVRSIYRSDTDDYSSADCANTTTGAYTLSNADNVCGFRVKLN